MNSCIYVGRLRHRRRAPVQHEFVLPLFMMYLDLEELDEVFTGRWLWSVRRPAPAWFRRADYLGDPRSPLPEAVRDRAEELTGGRPAGPIRVLTHLRHFGFVMNPVSFYYLFDARGERPVTILAEITNTPWRERHTYALQEDDHGPVCGRTHDFGKAFHVSPFMGMDDRYRWSFSDPGRHLTVHMENRGREGRHFDATLSLERRAISGRSLAGVLARYPIMTARVGASIYWHALRLRMKGAPYHEHPARSTT